MFETHTLLLYVAAALALVAAPGPGQALVTARTLAHGLRAGIVTSLGLNVGTLLHALAAAAGLSAILASSAAAFMAVKFLGAFYLIFLGWRGLRAKRVSVVDAGATPEVTSRSLFAHAMMTGVLNPKVALFFLAFLPQFVDPRRGSAFLQFMVLGGILAVLGVMGDSLVGLMAHSVHQRLRRDHRFALWRERVMGAALLALGIRLAFVSRN